MEERRTLTLLEEEILSEKVKQYPILYDKSHKGHKGHKEKDAIANCWSAISNELEFIENGR